MSALLAIWNDRLNPIVVKEVRQGLRTRLFWICFSLMLLACVFISLLAFATRQYGDVDSNGTYYFFAFFLCLGATLFFIIPYSAYRSLAREREDETWVLLQLTGLGPRKILSGKVQSFLVQAVLYGSAAGPFLLFSYYLNGIDLPTIGLLIALAAVYTLFLISVSVCTATLADSRLLRGLLHFALLGALLMAGAMSIGAIGVITTTGSRLFSDDEFWVVSGLCVWTMLSYGLLLFEAAASRLSLPTENYARGPRLAFLFQAVGSVGALCWAWLSESRELELLLAGQYLFMLNLGVVGIFLATDRDGQSAAQRAATRIFSLLRPGALRGFRFVVLVALLLTAALAVLVSVSEPPGTGHAPAVFAHSTYAIVAACAYAVLYLALAIIVTRSVRHPTWSSPAMGRVVFVFLLLVGSAGPPLVALMLGFSGGDASMNLFNPLLGPVLFGESANPWNQVRRVGLDELIVLGAVAAAAAVVADRLLAGRDAPAP